jgi:predicted GNAT family N-acyltransferase
MREAAGQPVVPRPSPFRRERVTVVRTVDDYLRVVAVRSVVYMGEQSCPYEEEFDGNDHCGMHLLGWIGDEPAASLRLRFFPDFAKVERLAVRAEFRRSTIAFRTVRHGLEFLARKGYRRAYGHARDGLEPFWQRFGARARQPGRSLSFSGFAYTEMEIDLKPVPGAVSLSNDPSVLNRPEGEWDCRGILEDSASRYVATLRKAEALIGSWQATSAADAWRAWSAAWESNGVRPG